MRSRRPLRSSPMASCASRIASKMRWFSRCWAKRKLSDGFGSPPRSTWSSSFVQSPTHMSAPFESSASGMERCAVCGGSTFGFKEVLWPELPSAWELTSEAVRYIDLQQGLHCLSCGNNLRMIALAAALLHTAGFSGTLAEFCESSPSLRILEINTAGFLTPFFRRLPGHRLVEYPQFDMMDLDIDSESFDIVVHSDSLEHVPDPTKGLSECRRVLLDRGRCIFTVPGIVGRLARSRAAMPPSHHGQATTATAHQLWRAQFVAVTRHYQ